MNIMYVSILFKSSEFFKKTFLEICFEIYFSLFTCNFLTVLTGGEASGAPQKTQSSNVAMRQDVYAGKCNHTYIYLIQNNLYVTKRWSPGFYKFY